MLTKKTNTNNWSKILSKTPHDKPLYRQIKNYILSAIKNEEFLPDDVFPSEVELANMMGVTRATVRQSTNELVAEGVLIREKGKRPRVAKPKSISHFLELAGISKYVDYDQCEYECKVLQCEYEKVSPEIAEFLGIRKNNFVFALERLRSLKGVIFGWEKTYMNKQLFDGIEKFDFSKESLYKVLKRNYNIIPSFSQGKIDVLVANSTHSALFNVREGTPLLSVRRTVYTSQDQPIQVNQEIYRGDCYSFAFKASDK